MSLYKDALIEFLTELNYEGQDILLQKLDSYRQSLYEKNQIVNMVSRKMPQEWYWTHHFLDSLLAMKCLDLSGKSVLDFGTGGGLPGLPLKFAVPNLRVILLDATQRKIDALRQVLKALNEPEKMAICARLEDYAAAEKHPVFDYIVCRAVALEPRYIKPLRELLVPGGKVIFYKAQKIDDIAHLPYTVELEEQNSVLGYRRIISLNRKDLR